MVSQPQVAGENVKGLEELTPNLKQILHLLMIGQAQSRM